MSKCGGFSLVRSNASFPIASREHQGRGSQHALLAGVLGLRQVVRLTYNPHPAPLIRSDSNGADDGLPALVDMNMLNPHELRAAAP